MRIFVLRNVILGHLVYGLFISLSITLWPNFWTVRDRDFILIIWHAYSTNETLSNDTSADDIVTLTMTFILKIATLDCDFLATEEIGV